MLDLKSGLAMPYDDTTSNSTSSSLSCGLFFSINITS